MPVATKSLSLPAKVRLRGQLAFEEWAEKIAHPPQLPPREWTEGTAQVWYTQGARGSGKTRTGSETLAYYMQTMGAGREFAAIGPTYGDARDTMVEHRKSGLLRALGGAVQTWNRSIGEMRLTNGAWLFIDGADDGAPTIEGKGLSMAWCDEIGKWKKLAAWQESLEFALREPPALIIATGTPKGKKGIVKLLLEEPEGHVVFTFPKLAENEANLSAKRVESWRRRYGGTRLGRQELEGEIIADVEGALWKLDTIERRRLRSELVEEHLRPIEVLRTVVAVDPAGTSEKDSDETGIVAAQTFRPDGDRARIFGLKAVPTDPQGLVLADASGIYSPTEWATEAVRLFRELRADRIVAEKNNGGEMVEAVIRQIDASVPVTLVWASKGKQTRAEPISALYEKDRVHHLDAFPDLESEQTSWVPGEPSPSRMDALVWALTELMLEGEGFEVAAADITPAETITGDLMNAQW